MFIVPRRNISVSPTVTIFGGMKPITSMTMSRITSRVKRLAILRIGYSGFDCVIGSIIACSTIDIDSVLFLL
jgi:hypothetical protein